MVPSTRQGRPDAGSRGSHFEDSHSPLWTISISVAPWVSPEEVARYFRRVRDSLLTKQPRRMGARNFEVYEFVRRVERSEGRPSWKDLTDRWNAANSDKKFKQRGHFSQAFMRAAKAVEAPGYHLPTPDQSPETQRAIRGLEERLVKSLEAYIQEHGNRWPEEQS